MDYVGGGKSGPIEVDILEKFYQATKNALVEAKNEVRIARFSLANQYLISHGIAVKREDQLEVGQTMARQERIRQANKGLISPSERTF